MGSCHLSIWSSRKGKNFEETQALQFLGLEMTNLSNVFSLMDGYLCSVSQGIGSSLKAGFQNIFSSFRSRKGSFP